MTEMGLGGGGGERSHWICETPAGHNCEVQAVFLALLLHVYRFPDKTWIISTNLNSRKQFWAYITLMAHKPLLGFCLNSIWKCTNIKLEQLSTHFEVVICSPAWRGGYSFFEQVQPESIWEYLNINCTGFHSSLSMICQFDYKLSTTCCSLSDSCLSLWPVHCLHPSQAAPFFCKHTDTISPMLLLEQNSLATAFCYCAPKQWNSLPSDMSHSILLCFQNSPLQTIPQVISNSVFLHAHTPSS